MLIISLILPLLLLLLQPATAFADTQQQQLSTRFILTSLNSTDPNATIRFVESFNFKFIDTIQNESDENDENDTSQMFIFESLHNSLKRNSFNQTHTFEDSITESMTNLLHHPDILTLNRELLLTRTKRDHIDPPRNFKIPMAFRHRKKSTRFPRLLKLENSTRLPEVYENYSEKDPMWPYLWYLNRHRFNPNLTDMNITSAWLQGFTGRGVSVTFLDDGLEWDHPDIKQNYDPEASYDFNDNDDDPMPRYDRTNENKHGTRCAGEVAAVGNNSICSIGIAYNAAIGGIRMLDGPITDSLEAKSMSLNNQHVDIYSASWGPTDNGQQLDGPDRLAQMALKKGATKGRKGLGSIFTWASGNGGIYGDTCACDGYVNNIYTFTISSTTEQETKPWYLEECTSVLATTYSSGDINRGQHSIATTDLRHKCTKSHTATSAAAPIAAGIIALALEANPKLTWRDVMFLVVLTSRARIIKSNNYFQNKAGFLVSSSYGFGLMDAGRMVEVAKTWKTVPEFHSCSARNSTLPASFKDRVDLTKIIITTDGCNNSSMYEVNYIEQVEVIVTIHTEKRGNLELWLTSPMGTETKILAKRPRDRSPKGFRKWGFTTLQLWGEKPQGEWVLEIKDFFGKKFAIDQFELIIHGTSEKPECYETLPNNDF